MAKRDEEAYARVKELWLQGGLTASEIGQRMGKSRSAVLGIVHRMGLNRDPASAQKIPKVRTPRAPKAPPKPRADHPLAIAGGDARHAMNPLGAHGFHKPPKPIKADALTPTAKPWVERGPRQCKWPFVVLDETFSCCAPVSGESPYCADHTAIAFTGIPSRKQPGKGAKMDGRW